MRWAGERHGREFAGYDELWRWSVRRARGLLGGHLGVLRRARLASPTSACSARARCPARGGSTGAELNYAENLLVPAHERRTAADRAVVPSCTAPSCASSASSPGAS